MTPQEKIRRFMSGESEPDTSLLPEPSPKRLEDPFSGFVTLTASERAYVQYALGEAYARGGFDYKGENHYELARRVMLRLLGPLRLTHLVSEGGTKLMPLESP